MSGRGWDRERDGPPPEPAVCTLLCYRLRPHQSTREWRWEPVVEMTYWSSVDEACRASVELSPCDAEGRCRGDHSVVFTDERGRVRCRKATKTQEKQEK